MKNLRCLCCLFAFIFVAPAYAQQIAYDSFDLFIRQLMKEFDTPGLAIGIIQNDSIRYLKGYGNRDAKQELKVDENTLFGIGSISKSFTALTLGILVDEGKIKWDDHVKDYLPYFALYDPYVTENFTIRDLLTHRSGLKSTSGGTLWYHSDLNRTEMIKGLKHLAPVSGFRDKPAYQNVMFVVAGEIVQAVTGVSWDQFLQSRVFKPLGMKNSTSISAVREANKNLAQPYVWNDDWEKVRVEQEKGDNLAPAGFIYSSAKDMISYMSLLLHDGIFEQDTIIAQPVLSELFKPQIIFPVYGPPFQNEFTAYGFGWWLTPKNGHKVIEHSGGIDGMSANLVMVKDLDFGLIILTNDKDGFPAFILTAKILQQLFNDPAYEEVYTFLKTYHDSFIQEQKEAKVALEQSRILGTKPSLALVAYTGSYSDEMYGEIQINPLNDEALEISFSHTPLFKGRLTHWHYDTFRIDWYDIRVPDGFLTFNFNAKQEVMGLQLDQENLLDVDFSELTIKKKK